MQDKITIGRFGRVYGIKGWISVISYTEPKENILTYSSWMIAINGKYQFIEIENSKIQQKNILVKIKNIDDREIVKTYTNLEIVTESSKLPQLPKGEYYWKDLKNLTVITKNGTKLGKVDHLLATGANDVLVVKNDKERLIPYIDDVIINIDIDKQTITVDWDAKF